MGAPDQESKGRCWPATYASRPAAQQSCFQKPRLPRVQACLWLGGRPLSSHPHSHWVSLGTGSDLAWFPGGLQRLWLSAPATDQFRDLGPKLWEPGFEEQEGTATWQFRESCAGWEINTKRLESLAALLPSDGMGRVPAGVEGGRWQALSHIQGWPPTMLASGLAPQAGSSLLMGEGNTASDCTNPRRSIRLPKHKDRA